MAIWNRAPVDYLKTTPFRDGAFHPNCRSGGSLQRRGMRPVFVCPIFRKQAERDPWAAERVSQRCP